MHNDCGLKRRIGWGSKGAEEVEQLPGVRVVPFIQYPYKIFYQLTEDAIVMLHVHTARQEP